MEIITKVIGIGLVALLIIIILKQYRPEFAVYVSLIAGMLVFLLIIDKLEAIINLINSISNSTFINNNFLKIIIKITGIAFLTEFAVSICNDAKETAIANKIELASKMVVMYMSLPIISSLLEVINKILP